jgi:hypothetical protein
LFAVLTVFVSVKRILLIALVLLGVLTGTLLALRDNLAAAGVRRVLRTAEGMAAARGVLLSNMTFARAEWPALRAVTCDGLEAKATIASGLIGPGPEVIAFAAGRVVVEAENLLEGRLLVTVLDGSVDVLEASGQPAGQRVHTLRLQAEISVDWSEPAVAVALLEQEVRRLARDGRCTLPMRLGGVARFNVGEHWYEVALRSERAGAETVLELDPEDVRRISRDYVRPLTESEIALVARNPARAPVLLRLSQQAYHAAERLRARDRTFPYDAYRHVYWSWLLTRQFGAGFAEEVTDAHEVGATYEFGEASRRMDVNNNAIGRAYAQAGVSESDLIARILNDPGLIRTAR